MIAMALQTVETHEWEIPAYKLDAFEAKIAQAKQAAGASGPRRPVRCRLRGV